MPPLTPDKLRKSREIFESGRKGKLWTTRNKIVAALALLYLISPIDLVPDWIIPIVGWLDDVGIIGLAALWISKHREATPLPVKEAEPKAPAASDPRPQA